MNKEPERKQIGRRKKQEWCALRVARTIFNRKVKFIDNIYHLLRDGMSLGLVAFKRRYLWNR